MKSIQFNYFASESDLSTVATVILEWCPHLVVFPPRGTGSELKGTPVRDAKALIPASPGESHFVCSRDDEMHVRTTYVDERISCIQIQENPVVEYSPSAPVDSKTVKIGRFYASYSDIEFMKRVRKLFRLLKSRAMQLDPSGIWVFPSAARTKPILKMWAGQDWENPFVNIKASDGYRGIESC